MVELTLLRREHALSQPTAQRELLESPGPVPAFRSTLQQHGCASLVTDAIEILQINVGKVCNQTCRHCHVDAGPDRRESMSHAVAQACLRLLEHAKIATLDITGGAPEMNPHFRELVIEARRLGRRVIDRCNLTILVAAGFDDLPEFLAQHQVEIVASLPCYLAENVDRQRGDHAFERSLQALRRLNALGYGQPGSDLILNLVYNPQGQALPPPQAKLEDDYRRELRARYNIEFTRLYTITNMPISRFLDDLVETGRYESYLEQLVNAFNPATLAGLMCRNTLSVDWQGRLYDCDFNQMLELPITLAAPTNVCTLDDAAMKALVGRPIATGRHCYGCTAGAGSSCQGALK